MSEFRPPYWIYVGGRRMNFVPHYTQKYLENVTKAFLFATLCLGMAMKMSVWVVIYLAPIYNGRLNY
jgi:hypothetical protein